MFHPMFYILQKYFSQFLVVFNITSEDEGTLWYFSEIYLTVFTNCKSYGVVTHTIQLTFHILWKLAIWTATESNNY